MDFDQMLETWRAQNTAPPYEVNRDALRQTLQIEDARVRRLRRRDMWIVCFGGPSIAVFAGLWVAISIVNAWPVIYGIAAALSFGMVVPWFGMYCMSRWRQTKRERNFGNTLEEEVRRNLLRLDHELSQSRPWSTFLWTAPIMLGAILLSWSVSRSQGHRLDSSFGGWWTYLIVLFWMFFLPRWASRDAKQKLEPRQRRLRELLAALEARE